VLRNDEEFRLAVAEIDKLLDAGAEPGTEEGERLEFLAVLVKAYEDERYPPEDATPQQVVEFMLEQRGMTRGELAKLLGGRSRVSDFFNGRRELSKGQARALSDALGIPLDLLLR
jgi:HTH-type transcriptional regulator / antitoxin HigA